MHSNCPYPLEQTNLHNSTSGGKKLNEDAKDELKYRRETVSSLITLLIKLNLMSFLCVSVFVGGGGGSDWVLPLPSCGPYICDGQIGFV
jgi:hypothetical protein